MAARLLILSAHVFVQHGIAAGMHGTACLIVKFLQPSCRHKVSEFSQEEEKAELHRALDIIY